MYEQSGVEYDPQSGFFYKKSEKLVYRPNP